jgi:DNA-nicking Smr family endonuclease
MARRARALAEQDRANWAAYARTLKPLPGHTIPDLPEIPPEPPATRAVSPLPPPIPTRKPLAPLSIGLQPAGVDNATWARFRLGKLAPSRTLDLHGQTAHRAHHALQDFVRRAHADHQRCIEIITGRGVTYRGEGGTGVLRRELPLWLNMSELRPLILAVTHPHAANDGAVRLLLRRIR